MTGENHQLIQQLNESRRRLELMRTVALELNRMSSLSIKLQNILSLLHEHFYIDYCMIFLPEDQHKKLRVESSYGYLEKKVGLEVLIGMGIVGLAAAKRIPINITGLERKRKYISTTSNSSTQGSTSLPGLSDPESQIAIPLIANDELVAVLMAESYNVCVFSKEDEEFLVTLSQSIAVSILNSRLFDMMEKIIEERTKDLRKSNETKNRLFSLISHDLRGPISSFHNITRLVNHYNKQNERDKIEMLSSRIDHSVHQLNALLDNLLNWAVTQTGGMHCQLQRVSLPSVVDEVIEMMLEAIRSKDLTIRKEYAAEIYVHADYNMIMSVLRNLLSNAVKYSSRGETILIRSDKDSTTATIDITDHGVGIEPARLTNIFEPSEKKSTPGTEKERGTGLGLMVARELIEMNGGTITISSEVQKGTTIQIKLPLS